MEKRNNLKITWNVLVASSCCMLLAACGGGGNETTTPTTTGVKSWGAVESIKSSKESALAPKIAISSNGNAIAVWQQRDQNGIFDIWVNYYDFNSGSWQTPELIEQVMGNSISPDIAMDGQGNAMVSWLNNNNLIGAYFNVSSRIWTGAMKINQVTTGIGDSVIIMSDSGSVFVGWDQVDITGTFNDAWVNRYNTGTGVWDGAVSIESLDFNANTPQLAVDDAGNAMATWSQKEGATGIDNIWAAYFDISTGKWGPAISIEDNTSDADNPDIAMDPVTGNAMVVWQQDDGNGTRTDDARSNYYDNATTTWSGPILMETSDKSITRPKITISRNGSVIAAWLQDEPSGTFFRDIHASQFDPVLKTWGSSILIEENSGDAFDLNINSDQNGNIMLSWVQEDPANFFEPNVWANYYDSISASWAGEIQLDTTDQRIDSADLAVSSEGNAIVTWFQDDGTGNQIFDVVATVFK